jgi:hypothetical protein
LGHWIEVVRFSRSFGLDMQDLMTAVYQEIRNQSPMAAPPQQFCTHQRRAPLRSCSQGLLKPVRKLCAGHVIRIPLE